VTSEQERYVTAKAAIEGLRAAIKAQMTPQGGRSDEQYCTDIEQLYSETGYYEALRIYHEAEMALMDWAHGRMRRLPQYRTHQQEIDKVFSTHLPSTREKAITLCMRLEA